MVPKYFHFASPRRTLSEAPPEPTRPRTRAGERTNDGASAPQRRCPLKLALLLCGLRAGVGGPLPGVTPSRPGDTTIRRARRDDARASKALGFSGAAARGAGPHAAEKGGLGLPRVIVGRARQSFLT